MQTRFTPLTLDQMSPEQRRIAERRMNGPLKRLGAPMNVYIRSPGLAAVVEPLSDYLRAQPLAIPDRLRELVILTMARHWTGQYPWSAHYPLAIKAGFSPAQLGQVAAGKRPDGLTQDEAAVYDFCKSLLDRHSVDDAHFAAVVARYGERGVAELVGLMGAYTTACLATIVDRSPLQEGSPRLEPLTQG
jgi:4-carboxymuconolactone decarboxylase